MDRIHAENHERMLAPARKALARSKADVRELALVGGSGEFLTA